MSNTKQNLHAIGLNPFAVTLLAESMLKSVYVKNCGAKPLTFAFPIQRNDCSGWLGVRITIEAVPVESTVTTAPVAPTNVTTLAEDLGALLARAHAEHQIITIDLIPREPYAMGSYSMCGSIRPGRVS